MDGATKGKPDKLSHATPILHLFDSRWRVERAQETEERLHAVFSEHHVRGEWFKLPFAVLTSLLNADTLDEFFEQ